MATRYWVGGAGTWDGSDTTHWASSSGGAAGASAPTSADNVVFDANSDSGSNFAVTVAAGAVCADFTASGLDRTMDLAGSGGLSVYGSWSNPSSSFTVSHTGTITFAATSSGKTIDMNGVSFGSAFTWNGASGGWSLSSAMTTTAEITLQANVAMSLDLNNFALTTPVASMNGTGARTLGFGSSGKIVITGNNRTVVSLNATNLSFTGTRRWEFSYTGGSGSRGVFTSGWSEANAPAIIPKTTAGAGWAFDTTATDTLDLAGIWGGLDLTGFAGTLANEANTFYGSIAIPSGATLSAGANAWVMGATSGTKTITSNGKTLDFPLQINGAGGTFQLADHLALGSTRTFNVIRGTFDANGKNVTAGTIASSNSNARTVTLGSGTWTAQASGTAWNFATTTNLTVNANTAVISLTSASAKTFAGGGMTWPTLNQGGAGDLTISGSNTFADITDTVNDVVIKVTAGTTQTLAALSYAGASGHTNSLTSTITSTFTLSKASGTISVSYLTISYCVVTGGATWNALTANGNVDNGNNTGWNFHLVTPLACAMGSFAYSGQAALLATSARVAASAGIFSYSGQAAILRRNVTLAAAAAGYSYDGQGAAFTVQRGIAGGTGSFNYAGQPANLQASCSLAAGTGSFGYSGQDADFATAPAIAAQPGVFSYSGQAALLRTGASLRAEPCVFTVVGQAAALTTAARLQADQGAFEMTGQVMTPRFGSGQALAPAQFTYVGPQANLLALRVLVMLPGVIAYFGQAVGFAVRPSPMAVRINGAVRRGGLVGVVRRGAI